MDFGLKFENLLSNTHAVYSSWKRWRRFPVLIVDDIGYTEENTTDYSTFYINFSLSAYYSVLNCQIPLLIFIYFCFPECRRLEWYFMKIDIWNIDITKSLSPNVKPPNAHPPKSISRLKIFSVEFGDRLNSTEKIFEKGSGGWKKAAEAISGLQNWRGPFIIKKILFLTWELNPHRVDRSALSFEDSKKHNVIGVPIVLTLCNTFSSYFRFFII